MSELAWTAVICGGLILFVHVPCVVMPGHVRAAVKMFPRSKWSGWILTACALGWAAWVLATSPLGRIERYKPLLYVLTPGAFVLIIFFMDELLAPRALGGLMLLAPLSMLSAAKFHESSLSLVIVVLAYVLVVAGMTLVLSPYLFRKIGRFCIESEERCQGLGVIGVGFGILVVILGLMVY
jgi:uncharacterized membrane protein YhaH (DUF805 family)